MLGAVVSFVRRYLRMLVLIVAAVPAVDWFIEERMTIAHLQETYDVIAPRWGKLNIRDPEQYHVLNVPSAEEGVLMWRIYVPRQRDLTVFLGSPGRSVSSNNAISNKQPFEFVFQVKLGRKSNGYVYATTMGRALSANIRMSSTSLPADAEIEVLGKGVAMQFGRDETVSLALFHKSKEAATYDTSDPAVRSELPRIALGNANSFAVEAAALAEKKKKRK